MDQLKKIIFSLYFYTEAILKYHLIQHKSNYKQEVKKPGDRVKLSLPFVFSWAVKKYENN